MTDIDRSQFGSAIAVLDGLVQMYQREYDSSQDCLAVVVLREKDTRVARKEIELETQSALSRRRQAELLKQDLLDKREAQSA